MANVTETILGRLERIPFSGWHKKLVFIAFLGVFFDATDFALFGTALPPIAKEFGLNPQQAGFLATVGLAGAFVGALFWGSISDYIGRKTAFQATVGIFAIFTGLMALSWNTFVLGGSRFLANFGLGGEVPVTGTLVTEFMPKKVRGAASGIVFAAFGTGQVFASLCGLLIVPTLGWRTLFLLGTLPALLIWVVRRSVPESVRYLLSKNRLKEAEEVVSQIERASGVQQDATSPPPAVVDAAATFTPPRRVTVAELFSPALRRRTILLWIASIGLLWAGNGMIFMLPLILTERGLSLHNALTFSLLLSIFGVIGYLSTTFLMDRLGRRVVLPVVYIVGAALHIWFAFSSGTMMYVATAVLGLANPGGFGACTIYSAELYPTPVRSTGVGWFFGIGRIGSFLAPFIIGAMIYRGLSDYVMYTFAFGYLIAGLAVIAIGIETRDRALDTIIDEPEAMAVPKTV